MVVLNFHVRRNSNDTETKKTMAFAYVSSVNNYQQSKYIKYNQLYSLTVLSQINLKLFVPYAR